MKIDKVCIYSTLFPLIHDYQLSFGTVKNFESIFVKITSDGKTGWGECTPLNGYTSDSIESVYSYIEDASSKILGKGLEDASGIVAQKSGFSGSALMMAIEMLSGKIKWSGLTKRVPLTYLIRSKAEKNIKDEIIRAGGKGYSVFKHKIGVDINDDLKRADTILDSIPENAKVRFDANQGYEFQDAIKFIKQLDNDKKVEIIEQPLAAGEWENTKRLSESTDIPIMLDESITGENDILKTANTACAKYIKLKLFKCGGFENLKNMANLGIEKGLKVIIGNGVSTELGCLLEAKAWEQTSRLALAGEMNGCLKMKTRFIDSIKEDSGAMEYRDIDVNKHIDQSLIEKHTLNKKEIS